MKSYKVVDISVEGKSDDEVDLSEAFQELLDKYVENGYKLDSWRFYGRTSVTSRRRLVVVFVTDAITE
jgi:hypothetical protein